MATGCSSHTQVVVKSRDCAIPTRIELKSLDNRYHIGSEKNVAIMILNIADMVAYIKSLESALKCFNKGEQKPHK